MNIPEETILKNIFVAEKALKRDAKKYTDKLVLSKVFCFSKTPRDHDEFLEIVKNCLNKHNFRWFNLTFIFPHPANQSITYPSPKTFLFGKKRFILKNIEKIIEKIITGSRWIGKEAGVSLDKEFSIEKFI